MTFSNRLKVPLPIFFVLILLGGCSSFHWSQAIDKATLEDSWITYRDFYSKENHIFISKDAFEKRANQGHYTTISPKDFLSLGVENQRLGRYFDAKTAEEAYPSFDRPRKDKDIASINYFLEATQAVSPITVAIILDKKGEKRLIKLDGVHRMLAAHMLNKNLRILWIDLR